MKRLQEMDERYVTNLLTVLRYTPQADSWRSEARPFHCLALELAQGSIHATEHQTLAVGPGDVLFLSRETEYSVREARSDAIVVHFELQSPEALESAVFHPADPAVMRQLFEKLADCWQNRRKGWHAQAMMLLYEILYQLLPAPSPHQGRQQEETEEALRIARLHLSKADFGVEEWAAQLHRSRQGLRRMMLAAQGNTPDEVLTRMRMELACDLLKNTCYTISEVAEHTGYASLYAFSRAFRRSMGDSPSGYRNR